MPLNDTLLHGPNQIVASGEVTVSGVFEPPYDIDQIIPMGIEHDDYMSTFLPPVGAVQTAYDESAIIKSSSGPLTEERVQQIVRSVVREELYEVRRLIMQQSGLTTRRLDSLHTQVRNSVKEAVNVFLEKLGEKLFG